MNISSVVIKCVPEHLAFVLEQLHVSELCDVYLHDELGRIVIVLEGDTTEAETEKLQKLQQIPHILSAEVAMVYSDTEFSAEEGKLEQIEPSVLTMLNADNIDARDIVYQGHVKDK